MGIIFRAKTITLYPKVEFRDKDEKLLPTMADQLRHVGATEEDVEMI